MIEETECKRWKNTPQKSTKKQTAGSRLHQHQDKKFKNRSNDVQRRITANFAKP